MSAVWGSDKALHKPKVLKPYFWPTTGKPVEAAQYEISKTTTLHRLMNQVFFVVRYDGVHGAMLLCGLDVKVFMNRIRALTTWICVVLSKARNFA